MTVERMNQGPGGTISSLADSLRRLESVLESGMPRDLDLRDWLDNETQLLTALAATHPSTTAEVLVKAGVAIRRLLQMVEQDVSDEVALGKSVLADLQAWAPAAPTLPSLWSRAA